MLRWAILILLASVGMAHAQSDSTNTQVVPGFMTRSGCATGVSPCFIPYSATNPLPVAQSVGASSGVTSTQTAFTIATGNTFQSIAAASASRKSCLIQNTSTHTMYVFFGATGTASLTNTFQVPTGQFMSCATVNGLVLTDNIAVTTGTTSDPGVLNLN